MLSFRSSRPRSAVIRAGAASLLLAACGPAGDAELADNAAEGRACAEPTASALGQEGVKQYLTRRDPRPLRFLNPVSSDSALPASAMAHLNSAGPTYLYPPNPDQQATVRAKLADGGGWPTLLVAYHGIERLTAREAEIRFSGAYVGGADDGTTSPPEAVRFVCRDAQWVLPGGTPADSAAAPAQRGA